MCLTLVSHICSFCGPDAPVLLFGNHFLFEIISSLSTRGHIIHLFVISCWPLLSSQPWPSKALQPPIVNILLWSMGSQGFRQIVMVRYLASVYVGMQDLMDKTPFSKLLGKVAGECMLTTHPLPWVKAYIWSPPPQTPSARVSCSSCLGSTA